MRGEKGRGGRGRRLWRKRAREAARDERTERRTGKRGSAWTGSNGFQDGNLVSIWEGGAQIEKTLPEDERRDQELVEG